MMTANPNNGKRQGLKAFVIASITSPLALIITGSCGTACGGCPVPGGCFVLPAIVVAIVALRSRLDELGRKLLGAVRQ